MHKFEKRVIKTYSRKLSSTDPESGNKLLSSESETNSSKFG